MRRVTRFSWVGFLAGSLTLTITGSEPESFSGATERRARKASGLGAKRSIAGYGEHLQRRLGVFGRDERA